MIDCFLEAKLDIGPVKQLAPGSVDALCAANEIRLVPFRVPFYQ